VITTTLASFPSPPQGVWHLGPVPIRAYAVFIIIGILVALLLGDRRWTARGGESGVIYDIALWAVPFGLIGGRLYHVLTDWKTYFGPGGAGPVAALRVWDGGLGIWGAVALGGVGAWIACRRRGIPLPAFGDAIAPGIVLAQAIGRLGNYFNQELYGRETTLPWGMEIFYRRDPSGMIDVHSLNGVSTGQVAAIVHPTFLYELLWNLLVFIILLIVDRRFRIGHGRLFALYVALYCVGRFCVELLRDDTATHIAGIRINSFTSTFVFLGAVVYIILARKGREDPSTLGGREDYRDHEEAPELARELVAVASGTGLVAAATVAGREDYDDEESDDVVTVADELESIDEFEPLDEFADEADALADIDAVDAVEPPESEVTEPEALSDESSAAAIAGEPAEAIVAGDADDIAADAEDEAIIEAEVAAPAVEVETVDEAEGDLIDEDHDPIDEEQFEGLSEAYAVSGPLSEQAEKSDEDQTDDGADEDVEAADGAIEADEGGVAEAIEADAAEVVDMPAESAEYVPSEISDEPVEPVGDADEAPADSSDSSEMIIEYPSEPIADGIVFAPSDDSAGSDADTTGTYPDEAHAGETDTDKGDTGETDTDEGDTGETETSEGDTGEADTGETDTGETDTGDTDTGETDIGDTDTGEADTGGADTGETDTGEADTGEADTGDTDTGEGAAAGVTVGDDEASQVESIQADGSGGTPEVAATDPAEAETVSVETASDEADADAERAGAAIESASESPEPESVGSDSGSAESDQPEPRGSRLRRIFRRRS